MMTLRDILDMMTTKEIFENYVYPYFNGGGPLYKAALEEIEKRYNALEQNTQGV